MTLGAGRTLRVLVAALREPWPLDHGGNLRLYNFLAQLSDRARVTLLLPHRPRNVGDLPAGVEVEVAASRDGTPGLPRTLPDRNVAGRLARRHFGFDATFGRWLWRNARPARFDVALLSGAATGVYASSVRIPVLWDVVDELTLAVTREARYANWRTWPDAARRAALYALYERYVARTAATTIAASAVDADRLRRWSGADNVVAISNGVDLDYFHASGDVPSPETVVFVGSLEFAPNVDAMLHFAGRVWPQLAARSPRRRLLIVGRNPTPAVRALERVPGVEVVPDVPDVRPYYAQASAVIVPTRMGGGVKNKILEACAMRRPVVASPRAAAGLSARPGRDLLCARTPSQWAAQVHRLLVHPAQAQRIASNGHAWVRKAHRWSVMGDKLLDLLAAMAGTVPAGVVSPLRRARLRTAQSTGRESMVEEGMIGASGNAPEAVIDGTSKPRPADLQVADSGAMV